MTIPVEWLDDAQTILIYRVEGKWTTSDLPELSERTNLLLDSVSHRVDMIGDFTQAEIPSGNILLTTRRTLRGPHPNRGLVVLVGLNPFLRGILSILKTVYPHRLERYETVSTIEAAQEVIYRSRESDEVQC